MDTNSENLEDFLKEKEMDWRQIIQPKQWDDEITTKYNVYIVPRSFIIGRDGKIVGKNLRGEELEKKVAKLFNSKCTANQRINADAPRPTTREAS